MRIEDVVSLTRVARHYRVRSRRGSAATMIESPMVWGLLLIESKAKVWQMEDSGTGAIGT